MKAYGSLDCNLYRWCEHCFNEQQQIASIEPT